MVHAAVVLKHLHGNCNKQLWLAAVQALDSDGHALLELKTLNWKKN